jgi:hypothetical protein
MKRSITITLSFISFLVIIISSQSCKKEEKPFNDDAQKSYEAVISLQAEGLNVLASYKTTMDSALAVEQLAQWFRDTSLVESAVVSSQGISVKYSSGVWGGILLDPKRYDEPGVSAVFLKDKTTTSKAGHLKNIPTSKKTMFLPASISEFPESNIRQDDSWNNSFTDLGYGYDNMLGGAVDLDCLAGIQKLGSVLCLDSHGYAWPADDQVSDVYFITGEKASNPSTEKYYQDIIDHDILVLQFVNQPTSTYAVSPGFITKYNDFSQDTVLFYGGFCYSYLGNWPSLADACASGTYFGFDWTVRSNKCTDWAIDLVDHLADQDAAQPWTVEGWMSSSTIAKEYFDAEKNKTVHILYNGNGALTLWKAAGQGNGTIISTSSDGAPLTIAGFTCTDYVLQCLPAGQLPEHVGYEWDYGDGSSTYYTVDDNLALYHHWAYPQTYHVTVTITDISTQSVIMELGTEVSFVYPDYLPQLKSNSILEVFFGPDQVIQFTGAVTGYPNFSFSTAYYEVPLTWSDSGFYSQDLDNNDYETITIEGNVSSNGRILRRCILKKVSQDQPDHELTLEITELPVLSMDPINCISTYFVNIFGQETQGYLSRVEYKEFSPGSGTWTTISSIDWANAELMLQFRSE